MSVAAASGAVSTQQHYPNQEQIRLAQLIDDKKHDQPEIQDIVRKVLDVVANSSQEDALVALFDCDYDYERTVALLIEKGNEISSEWRTATHHKATRKQQQQQQQQQKIGATKNGHGGEMDENAQQRDGSTYRGKSRGGGGWSRTQQQQNGGDSQNNTQQQQNENYAPQQRYRGGSGYRGRYRGSNRGSHRGNDRNYQQYQYEQQPQDSNIDSSTPSDITQSFTDVPYRNRRGGGKQQHFDRSDWNGESLNFSKSTKDEERPANSENNNASNARCGVLDSQISSSGILTINNVTELNTQQKSKGEFDPVEAARQIKNVIGIGQAQQQNIVPPKPLMDLKPILCDQQTGQQQKSNIMSSKSTGQNLNTKGTPSPPQQQQQLPRIPHQPVIFTDRFDGGVNKIDVQFGNLGETSEEQPSHYVSASSSAASAFYSHSEPITSATKPKNVTSSGQHPQRSTGSGIQHQSNEQSAFVSLSTHCNTARLNEQQPVLNQPRMMPTQLQQQPSMSMKPVLPTQYTVHHPQHQMNPQSLLLPSLLYHQQQEPVPLDNSYDPTAFQLPSMDFNASYFMAAAMSQQPLPQQQNQPRYLVSQQPPPPNQQQQMSSNRQQSSTNAQPSSLSTSSSSVQPSSTATTTSTAPKKGPAVPPGMFLSTGPPSQASYSAAYSAAYGVPPSVGGQQQTGATTYSTPYEAEHLFANSFLQLANVPQAQSPSGTYGSVTPPVQQQNQTHNNNDKQSMNYRTPVNENHLLQQFQQFSMQQSNNQQQGIQTAHSPAQLNYFLGHSASGPPSYSAGPQIMYAQPAAAMSQQQASKQLGQQYNQTNSSSNIGGNDDYYGRSSSSSANKETHYMYAVSAQPQQIPPQSVGQHQGMNKQQQQAQQQQRNSGNVYNNQQSQQRPF
ncbi:unnamed protein product [Rotaria magnacalcarata]|uniref:Uncharacterized protein n=5 Tax=Rotaria magnacalcarata TaxID=392030 RepID=A0A818YGU9_9BILA|nr:unnamed protein product [Rotaria magnacalcarata]CAF3754347.1 unnamed protein product [Rotaria magnacalcarata]